MTGRNAALKYSMLEYSNVVWDKENTYSAKAVIVGAGVGSEAMVNGFSLFKSDGGSRLEFGLLLSINLRSQMFVESKLTVHSTPQSRQARILPKLGRR